MSEKASLLKQRVLENIERLDKIVRLNAPAVIIGEFAFNLYATVLAAYGEEAGHGLIKHIREQNLQQRGVCTWGDCVNPIERDPINICEDCQKELGCDDESMRKMDEEAKKLEDEWREEDD